MTHRLRTTGLDMLDWFIGEERVEVTFRVQARREYQGRGRFRGMCKFQVDRGFIQDGYERSERFVEELSIRSYQQAIVEVADHQLTVAPVCSCTGAGLADCFASQQPDLIPWLHFHIEAFTLSAAVLF